MDKNPYSGASGSDNIKSNVMGLSLTGLDGKPLDLSGQTLTMFVKRDTSQSTKPLIYNSTKRKEGITYHRFNFTSDINVMAIEMRPFEKFVSSKMFIKKNMKPSVTNLNNTYVYEQRSEQSKVIEIIQSYL